jgi:hypothetical protein
MTNASRMSLPPNLQELTERVIREAINDDTSEAAEGEPKALTAGSSG